MRVMTLRESAMGLLKICHQESWSTFLSGGWDKYVLLVVGWGCRVWNKTPEKYLELHLPL